jgi:hypothetical protein
VWWNLETRFPTPSLGAGAWPYLVVIAE